MKRPDIVVGTLLLTLILFFGCVQNSDVGSDKFNSTLQFSGNFTQDYYEGNADEYRAAYRYTQLTDKYGLYNAGLDIGFAREMEPADIPTVEEFFEQISDMTQVHSKTFSKRRIGKYNVDIVDAIISIPVDQSQVSDKYEQGDLTYTLEAYSRIYYIRNGNNLMFINVQVYGIDEMPDKPPTDQIYSEVEDAILKLEI